MIMTDDSWFAVRNTPGVTEFVSAEDETDRRPKPVPLKSHEVDGIMKRMQSGSPSISVGLSQGDSVKIFGWIDCRCQNKERGKSYCTCPFL